MQKRARKNYNSLLIEKMGVHPIAYNAALGHIAKSASAGLFLCQLLYWWEKGSNKDWVYKTVKEVRLETCLTRSEQARAIRKWGELGVLEVKLRGIPRRRHFRIDTKRLGSIAEGHIGGRACKPAESYQPERTNRPAITENTQKNTKRYRGFDKNKATEALVKKFSVEHLRSLGDAIC